MVVCECCNGNCDNGELVQGICPECREEKERRKLMNIISDELLQSDFFQISLGLEGMQNL